MGLVGPGFIRMMGCRQGSPGTEVRVRQRAAEVPEKKLRQPAVWNPRAPQRAAQRTSREKALPRFFPNILTRDCAELPEGTAYIAGFPCQAPGARLSCESSESHLARPCLDNSANPRFSSLRTRSDLLQDKGAKQFWKVVEALSFCQPAVAILENVKGLNQALPGGQGTSS